MRTIVLALLTVAAAALAAFLTAGAASSAVGWSSTPCYQIVSGDPHGFHSTVWVCPHQATPGHARPRSVGRTWR